MVLPHDVRLAAENATKSLASDALKASATGGPEASKAAEAALSEGRLPLALVYARKASEKLEGAEAKCLLGEVLLQVREEELADAGAEAVVGRERAQAHLQLGRVGLFVRGDEALDQIVHG